MKIKVGGLSRFSDPSEGSINRINVRSVLVPSLTAEERLISINRAVVVHAFLVGARYLGAARGYGTGEFAVGVVTNRGADFADGLRAFSGSTWGPSPQV